jgi:hypothetical protein
MAKRKQDREVVNMAADDGDEVASAIARDQWDEEGPGTEDAVGIGSSEAKYEKMASELIKPIGIGQHVIIFGVPYFWRGIYLGEDHQYIYLAPGCFKCYETGPLSEMQEQGHGSNEEELKKLTRVRKGCVSAIVEL